MLDLTNKWDLTNPLSEWTSFIGRDLLCLEKVKEDVRSLSWDGLGWEGKWSGRYSP